MSSPHHYVDCDVPEGMTLREYHAARRASAPRHRRHGLMARLRRRRAERRRAAAARGRQMA